MNTFAKRGLILFLLNQLGFCGVHGQSSFQNLGFNSGALVPIPADEYQRVEFASALPGWSGYVGGVQQSGALYNNMFLESSGIGIVGTNFIYPGHLDGQFTLFLQAGVRLHTTNPITDVVDSAIAQTGLVPGFAQSLQFKALHGGGLGSGPGDLVVTLGGQTLSLIPVGNGANYTLYGADVRNWAGQTAELRFTAVAVSPHARNNNWFLDSIAFSTTPIPEPGVLTLMAFAAFLTVSKCLSKVRDRNLQASRPMQCPSI